MATQLPHRQRHPAPIPINPMFAGLLPSMTEHLDPNLLALVTGNSGVAQSPLDPALFAIEQVVNDVNRGRIAASDLAMSMGLVHREDERHEAMPEESAPVPVPIPEPVQMSVAPHTMEPQHEEVAVHVEMPSVDVEASHLEDDGIDPALREIVNSLTNAQQSHHPSLPTDAEERDRIDHEAIRTTLEDYAAQNGFSSYGAMFGGNFPHSPNNQNLMLPSLGDAHDHNHDVGVDVDVAMSGSLSDVGSDAGVPIKRGRGRPKGSKNKPKPRPPTPEPVPEPPRRRKGRPPKIRSEEEIAEIKRREEEKVLGIKRKRGRPRKYPELGLVREMRLKKNREAVQEKIRMLEERARLEAEAEAEAEAAEAVAVSVGKDHEQAHNHGHHQLHQMEHAHTDITAGLNEVALGEQVAAAVAREQEQQHEHYDWPYQDGQSLLDVVRGVGMGMGDDQRMDVGVDVGVGAGVGVGVGVGMGMLPSDGHHHNGLSQGDDMRGVFALADVSSQQ